MSALKIKGKLLAPKQVISRSVTSAGDASVTVENGPGKDLQIVDYAVPITAARTVTLATAGAEKGQVVRVVRRAAATGASAVDFGGLKSLTVVSQWAEAFYDGAAWALLSFGAL